MKKQLLLGGARLLSRTMPLRNMFWDECTILGTE